MADALQGIEQDVPFDFGAAADLISSARAAASDLRGQRGSRQAFVRVAMGEFRGYFSELFEHNAATARGDADELADRLDQVAGGVESLRTEARNEQRRREVAREWKREQERRSWLSQRADDVSDFFTGEDEPPVGPPAAQVSVPVSDPPTGVRRTPAPGSGGRGGGTSSARPTDLRSFASGSTGADGRARASLGRCRADYAQFTATCHWGSLSASGVFAGGDRWLSANGEDARWARTVADAFEAAGGAGQVSTLADSAIAAALQAAGVSAVRQDLTIDPPAAYGSQPTSGYADDPVNTATGNFLEPESDLAFGGGCAGLAFTRMYNSLNETVGALGLGWSAWSECGLVLDDEAARLTLPDGREVTFPRLGDGWDRAIGENLWLERHDGGYRVRGNDGTRWQLSRAGRLLERSTGPGTAVRLEWDSGEHGARLVRMAHERGRHLDLRWGTTGTGAERLLGLLASDGREVHYAYDDQDRLVAASSALGTRRYRWDDRGLVAAVVDAHGAVEVENAYDEQGRVARQRSVHGRVTRYAYLPGRVTVVSDEDGGRSNTWVADQRGRLVGVVDADEQRQSTSYDAHGNAVSVTERDGATTVREHDERGRLVRTVTPQGTDLRQTWDEQDRLLVVSAVHEDDEPAATVFTYADGERNPATITDPEGGVTAMTWRDGLLLQVVDPTGVTVRFTYDRHGDLVGTGDADGGTARLERDDAGRVVAAVTPSGSRTTYEYDGTTGMLVGRTDPGGGVWRYEHTVDGRTSVVIDPAGGRTETEHAPDGQVSRTVDPLGRAVTRTFDDLGNVASVELPDGATWRFGHDALSRLRRTTDPAGGVWTQDHDVVGAPRRVTSATGETSVVSTDRLEGTVDVETGPATAGVRFDRLGRLVASERPDGSTLLTRYDRCGRAVELVDAGGGVTTLERDAAGRVVGLTRPGGGTVGYEYDRCGRLATVVDELGGRTGTTYDADGRVIAQTLPTGDRATWSYDADGRVVRRRVPGRGTTMLAYDAAGRVVDARDPEHGRRRFRYDAAGQLVEAVDANGGVTRWEYDANGRAVRTVHPDGGVTVREFDAMNRCVLRADPLGRTTRAGYDASGRQVWQEDPSGRVTAWEHDSSGRLVAVRVDGEVVASARHDPRRRRSRVVDHVRPGVETVHELAWDARGNLVSRTRDGRGLAWTYDVDGRRVSRTGPDGSRVRYERDAAGRVVAIEHDSLGRTTLERDAAGRVVRADSGGLDQTWRYAGGFVVGHSTTDGARTSTTVVDRDDDGRVRNVARDGSSLALVHDDAHQLVEARLGDLVTRWRYDAAGRLVAESRDGSIRTLVHDAAGQLLESTGPDGTTTHRYDAAGRRTSTARPDGTSRGFEWDRLGWMARVVDRDGRGAPVHTVTAEVDALGELRRLGGADVFWDSADERASAPAEVAGVPVVAAGAALGVGREWRTPGWRAARETGQDPWALAGPEATDGPGIDAPGVGLGAAGEMTFAGLEWMGRRVYDPRERGFLSVDPVPAVPGSAWAANPYSFAGNDPMHATDPTGLQPLTDADLQEYLAQNAGAFAAAGDWMSQNWEYVAGGAMVVAGGVLIATGVGGPAGLMLMSAGADTIIQRATTGGVNWGQVAVAGAFGAWGGAGAAARMGVTSRFGQAVVGGMVSGGAGGGVSSAVGVATGPGPHTPEAFLRETVRGTVYGVGTGGVLGAGGHHLEGIADRRLANAMADGRLSAEAPTPTVAETARAHLGNPGDTVVLGRQPDTAVAADWPDHAVLRSDDWSLELNDEFIQGAIDYQRPVYLASGPEGNLVQTTGDYAGQPTIFARELDQLDRAGYRLDGDVMERP